MKKLIVLFVVVALVAAVATYLYQVYFGVRHIPFETIVPADAIYYASVNDVLQKFTDLQKTPLAQQFMETPVYRKYVDPALAGLRDKWPVWKEFLDKDIAVAVFTLTPLTGEKGEAPPIGNFLCFFRFDPSKHITLKKGFSDLYLTLTAKEATSLSNYRGITVTRYKPEGFPFAVHYCILGDALVFSNDGETVKQSIDLFRRASHESLAGQKEFKKLFARIPKNPLGWCYVGVKNYYKEVLRNYTDSSLRTSQAKGSKSIESLLKLKPFIDLMNILEGSVVYCDYAPDRSGIMINGYQSFNSAADETDLLRVIAFDKTLGPDSFQFVGREGIGYYGFSQDIASLWKFLKRFVVAIDEMWRSQMENDPRYAGYATHAAPIDPDTFLKRAESSLGISIERQLLPLFGTTFGAVCLSLEDLSLPLPRATPEGVSATDVSVLFPGFVLFAELKDGAKAKDFLSELAGTCVERANARIRQSIIERLRRSQPDAVIPDDYDFSGHLLSITTEDAAGVEIVHIQTPFIPEDILALNYCIVDKYLLFSFSPSVTRKAISSYKDRTAAGQSLAFASACDKLPEETSSFAFLDTAALNTAISSSSSFKRYQEQQAAQDAKKFSQEDLASLMSFLGNFTSVSGSMKKVDADTVSSSLFIAVEGL